MNKLSSKRWKLWWWKKKKILMLMIKRTSTKNGLLPGWGKFSWKRGHKALTWVERRWVKVKLWLLIIDSIWSRMLNITLTQLWSEADADKDLGQKAPLLFAKTTFDETYLEMLCLIQGNVRIIGNKVYRICSQWSDQNILRLNKEEAFLEQ